MKCIKICKIGAYSYGAKLRKHFFKSTDTFGDEIIMAGAVALKKIGLVNSSKSFAFVKLACIEA